jgi:RimJ/RimL family protein N-acetyltransferase
MSAKPSLRLPLPAHIQTHRLSLQLINLEHAPALFAVMDADRERLSRTMLQLPSVTTLQDHEEKTRMNVKRQKEGSAFGYCIFLMEDGAPSRLTGAVGVHSISKPNLRGELGYWITGEFEGLGFISEAIRALEKTCWEAGFHGLEVRCSSTNMRSVAVPKRLGYSLDGRHRDAWWDLDQWADTLVFSKLRGE